MHNLWSVDPDPRGVGRLGAGSASSHGLRAPAQAAVSGQGAGGGGGPVAEMPGSAVRSPDSLLRGPVSTALT